MSLCAQQVIPAILGIVRTAENREFLFQQLGQISAIVKQHIKVSTTYIIFVHYFVESIKELPFKRQLSSSYRYRDIIF